MQIETNALDTNKEVHVITTHHWSIFSENKYQSYYGAGRGCTQQL